MPQLGFNFAFNSGGRWVAKEGDGLLSREMGG